MSASSITTGKQAGESASPVSRLHLPKLDTYQWALLVLIAVYVVVFARLAFDIHAGMRTHKADLGQIDQAIWNSSQGRFLQQTDGGTISTRMTDHVEPILIFISPVYWLWNDVRAILLLQVIFVAVGAWLLYHLALHRLDRALPPAERTQIWRWEPLRQWTRPISLALAIAWLLAAPLQSAILTEFHAAPLAAPLILWALWALERFRWRRYALAVILVALVKEEMALVAFMLGLWGIYRGWRASRELSPGANGSRLTAYGSRLTGHETPSTPHVSSPITKSPNYQTTALLWGGAVALFSLLWFALATFVIVPYFAAPFYGSEQSTYFARYGALGNSPTDIVRAMLTQPQLVWSILSEPARLVYLWRLLALFALLGVIAPELLALSLPVLLANVLSAYPAQFYGEFHYTAPVVPFFAAAAAFGVARLWGVIWRRTESTSASFQHLPAASTGAMAAASLVTNASTALRPIVGVLVVLWILGWAGWGYVESGRAWGGARYDPTPITAHHRLLPEFVAQVPADAPLTATAAVHPHLSHRQHIYQFPDGFDVDVPATWALLDVTTNTDMAPGDLKSKVDEMLAGEWGVVDAADGFLLLAQGAPQKEIPRDFFTFTYPPLDASTSDSTATTLLDWARWRQTRIEVDWRNWSPDDAPPRLDILLPNGDLIYTLDSVTPPALVWRPSDTWQPGDEVRVTTLPLTLPRAVAVRAAPGEVSTTRVAYRDQNGVLRSVSGDTLIQENYAGAIADLTGARLRQAGATFIAGTIPVTLDIWLADRDYWNGDTLDLWLQGRGQNWPEGYQLFAHLVRTGEAVDQIVAQQDGAPNLFGAIDAANGDALSERHAFFNDWRTLAIPAESATDGAWRVEVGLYNPETGERARRQDGGDTLTISGINLRSAIPDQACALNQQACASQPHIYPR